jgi:hypothetical protein
VIACFSLLYFKRRAGSPLSNDGRVLCLDLTSEICPPLQRSSCLYSDLTALVLSGILNGSNDQKCFSSFTGFRSFDQPELILFAWLHCLRSFDLPEHIFYFPVCYKLPVLMLLAINDKHSMSVKYFPTISPFGIDGNTSTHMHSDSTLLPNSFLPL